MDGGDLGHAARHLADALAADPRLPDGHEALAEFVARAGGAEQALRWFEPEPERTFIGTVAAHAHVSAMAGHWDQAVQELFAVAAHEPHRPWLDVAWLHRHDLPHLLSPNAAAIAVARFAQPLADPVDEDERAPLLPALAVLRGCVARHPDHAMLLWCGSTPARRLGAFDEAIAWSQRSFEVEPTHQAAVVKGYALRTAGRLDDALSAWQREAARTPEDHDLFLDLADLLEAMGRPQEGLDWARRAAEANPEHPKAFATVLGLRHVVDDDVRHLVALADHLRDRPEHTYAADVPARRGWGRAWLGQAPEPTEAVRGVATFHWPSLPAAYDRAVVLSGIAPHDLLGVLVHPPAPSDDGMGRALARHAPQLWLHGVQVWACLGLAHHHADEPWAESSRREILPDLLDGPEDWVAEAAALALVATAWVEPTARADVQQLVVRRMLDAAEAARRREVTVLASLCELVPALPDLDDRFAALARDVPAAERSTAEVSAADGEG